MRGIWLMALSGLLGAALSIHYYFTPGMALDGERGVLLTALSSLLMAGAAPALRVKLPLWLARLLIVLLLFDVIGTSLAGYFLETPLLIAVMMAALTGWLMRADRDRVGIPATGALALAALMLIIAATPTVSGWFRGKPHVIPDYDNQVWDASGGNQQAQKYSTATQITPANVKYLKVAWSLHTGDVSARHTATPLMTTWEATPLFVNNTVYVGTPRFRIFALEPDTGKVKWIYNPAGKAALDNQGYKTRGTAYWQAAAPVKGEPCQKIVYIGTMSGSLHAVDADSGKLCRGFGDGGILDVNQWNTINKRFSYGLVTPPAVYKDTLILGWAGIDWAYRTENPGLVFGIDARTGKLKWSFNPIPREMMDKTGTANVWAAMSVDPALGMVYLPVSSPSPNIYGGDRLTEMPYGTSTTALNAETGQVVWNRQLVHHDIWDLDVNSPPTLLDIKKDGQTIPALVQATKQGFLFVLNRRTGEPVYPIEERPYPASDIPGEKTSPTQPYVPLPEPTIPDATPDVFPVTDILSLGACSRWRARLKDEGRFTPPSLQGTLAYPATVGGVEWGGGAVNPADNTYVVNTLHLPQVYTVIPRAEADKMEHGKTGKAYGGLSAQAGSPYAFRLQNFINRWEMPCWKPPYGTLSSYDMNTGKLLWRKPFGQVRKWGFDMPESWGSVTIGGPVITKSGLVFIGASMDSRVRAIDLKSGEVDWKAQVDAPATATPAIYTYKGREYVVFAAGGNFILMPRVSDELVAFALPQ